MLQTPYTKDQIQKIIRADKKIKFVDSFHDVKEYYDQKIYAIEKDSVALKELINEGKFAIDNNLLPLKVGFYHIIDTYSKEVDIKSMTRTENIAYALHKRETDKDFWSKVYQIRINPLFNYVSETKYGYKYELKDLIGKSIYIKSIDVIEQAKSYKVIWGVCGDFMRHDLEIADQIELYESYLYENREERLLELYLEELEEQHNIEANIDQLIENYNSEERQIENYLDDLAQVQKSEKELEEYLDDVVEEDCYNVDLEDYYEPDN